MYQSPGLPSQTGQPSCTKVGTVEGHFQNCNSKLARFPSLCLASAGASGAAALQVPQASPRGLESNTCRQLTPFWTQ